MLQLICIPIFFFNVRYDQLLKTSHAFNILDSRGFVGVTERARYFGRMRRLVILFLYYSNLSPHHRVMFIGMFFWGRDSIFRAQVFFP